MEREDEWEEKMERVMWSGIMGLGTGLAVLNNSGENHQRAQSEIFSSLGHDSTRL